MKTFPLAQPDISDLEHRYVTEVLTSGILSIGPVVERFENAVRDYIGVKHAIAVNSGTSALHLIIRSMGIGNGDEVITTPFSFVASSNCILFEGATPVFVDINKDTLNIDLKKVESAITHKTKAILAVDVFGQPVDIDAVRKIADKYKLFVIEDPAEAIGSSYNGKKAGSSADAAVFAFYPNKQITTGEGGMIVTNDDNIAMLCSSMRSQGRAVTGQWLHHQRLGYNYRLSELHSALGVAQMERIDELLEKRRYVAEYYNQKLSKIKWLSIPHISDNVTYMSWFVYVVKVSKDVRSHFMDYLTDNGIACKPYFTPIHTQPFYQESFGYHYGDFPVADTAGDTCVAIPFYAGLSKDDLDHIVKVISEFI